MTPLTSPLASATAGSYFNTSQIKKQLHPLQAFPDVSFIDLDTLPFPQNHRRPHLYNGYVQKILSLYNTRFERVRLLSLSGSVSATDLDA